MTGNFTRRQFLHTTCSASLATGLSLTNLTAAEVAARPRRVDAHLHCFAGTKDPRFPYHARAVYRPEETATPEQLLKCMADAQVDYGVIVHPEPYQDDHRYLEHCLQVGKGKLKGTLLLFADREGSLDQLPDLCRRLDVVAVRVHAYAADRLPPFGKPELRRLWQLATDHALTVQLHFEPKYAAGFEPLIREFSKTKVVIDHLGRPFQATAEEHAAVVRWAKFDNTVMKLSSIPLPTEAPDRNIGAVIRQLTDAWGAERMIYGGGFAANATGKSYSDEFERARSFLAHLTPVDQAKIFGGTAIRLYRFKP